MKNILFALLVVIISIVTFKPVIGQDIIFSSPLSPINIGITSYNNAEPTPIPLPLSQPTPTATPDPWQPGGAYFDILRR